MKSKLFILCLLILALLSMPLSAFAAENSVLIYSSAEDYRNEHFLKRLKEQFPDYDIQIEYMSTGNQAAKLMAEGLNTPADIIYDMEYGYFPLIENYLADLSGYDTTQFIDSLIPASHKYLPELMNSGTVIVNTETLEKLGLPEPTCYADLLNDCYRNQLSMPSPTTSGTGYMFLKSLVNAMGEDNAYAYFDAFAENVLQFTSSGSGAVNALVQGEASIGLGMISQAVVEINEGAPLKILFFEEGAPYVPYGYGIIEGKQSRQAVTDVFDFFYNVLVDEDKQFFPETIYQDKTFEMENYPSNIPYADMSGNTSEEKTRLLEKWEY